MSSANLHPPVLDPHVVDRDAEGRLVETNASLEVELPTVPGAAKDAAAAKLIAAGRAGHTLADLPQAEWPAVMRTAVAQPVERAVVLVANDADLTALDPRHHPSGKLELLGSADVTPPAQSRSPYSAAAFSVRTGPRQLSGRRLSMNAGSSKSQCG